MVDPLHEETSSLDTLYTSRNLFFVATDVKKECGRLLAFVSWTFWLFPVVGSLVLWQTIGVRREALSLGWITTVFTVVAVSGFVSLLAFTRIQSPAYARPDAQQQDPPRPIYSENPQDPWNRIFACLFSRRVEARLSDEFPEGAPFTEFGKLFQFRISTRSFARVETGDRAIDPLYSPPATSVEGSRQLLIEPRYSDITAALKQALHDPAYRSPIARAMMQSDLWSGYDALFWPLFPEDRNTELDRHKRVITGLIVQLIMQLALTSEEIQSLPDNFAAARSRESLPDLFGPDSGWMEFQSLPDRLHDRSAGFRRVTRIFVKPAHPPQNKLKFLVALRDSPDYASMLLDGAALLIQPLLIDMHGNLSPSHLTTEVQIRMFTKTKVGTFSRTEIQLCELNRELMLHDAASGGLAQEDENSPAYLSLGGSYGFASPVSAEPGGNDRSPVIVKQRTRCTICHGTEVAGLMTFSFAIPPHERLPSIKLFNPAAHQQADYDVFRKSKRPEWRALHEYFVQTSTTRH